MLYIGYINGHGESADIELPAPELDSVRETIEHNGGYITFICCAECFDAPH